MSSRDFELHVSKTRSQRRLLTVREAAEVLAISVPTLYGWVWQRRIPFVKMGRAVRFDLAELDRFIDANRNGPKERESESGNAAARWYNTRAAGKG